jgi:integrase/recombinase XerD
MTSLRQRMIEDMQVRNLSKCTQESYVRQVSLFARHFKKSPELLGPEQIRAYQIYLMNEKKLAPISIMVAISALRFLYGVTLKKDWSFKDILPVPKKSQTLPIVLSPEEVIQFLACNIQTRYSRSHHSLSKENKKDTESGFTATGKPSNGTVSGKPPCGP